tara:strand:+ start:736 stop:1212 length:477 start_codon:yes stop_codon:yes gene_type:complete
MNKILRIIIILGLIFAASSCSYKPVFFQKTYNFKVEEVTLSGDKAVNSIISRNLRFIKSKDQIYKKKYLVKVDTTKERKIISKDSEGDPSKFEIIITTEYEIINNEKLLVNRKIQQKSIYNNESDKFKLEQSEKIIIENLSEKISESIIASIINLNDN